MTAVGEEPPKEPMCLRLSYLYVSVFINITMEPPNNGHIGGRIHVLCKVVVPISEVLASHIPQLRGCKVAVRGVV